MANKKISELNELISPVATDTIPIINTGETKKVKLSNLKNVLGITNIESGIWTPALGNRGTGGDPTVTYTLQAGFYTKIGNIVYFTFSIRGTITAVNGQNYATIKGLPIISENVSGKNGICNLSQIYNVIGAFSTPLCIIFPGQDYIRLQRGPTGSAVEQYVAGAGAFYLDGSGFYFA